MDRVSLQRGMWYADVLVYCCGRLGVVAPRCLLCFFRVQDDARRRGRERNGNM